MDQNQNRFAMLKKIRRSISIESENLTRQAYYRQSMKMNGNGILNHERPFSDSLLTDSCFTGVVEDSPSNTVQSPKLHRRKITLNVSGERYQTYVETLERFPQTLLGDAEKRNEFFESENNEYFFDRDRHAFAAILYYYQAKGQVYCPITVPLHVLVSEMNFFELGQDALNQILESENQTVNELPKNRLQREIWKLFEIPESGFAANVLTIFSVFVILCSVIILCIETLPYFKGHTPPTTHMNRFQMARNFPPFASSRKQPMFNNPAQFPLLVNMGNQTLSYLANLNNIHHGKKLKKTKPNTNWLRIFEVCETGIVAWFTLEFIVRFLSCPNKLHFVKSCMNIIDLLAIIPYYITLVFKNHDLGIENIRIIRLVRVFRIFKLSRHSRGLQILGLTLKASIRELGLLIFFLFIGVILFSSAVYYVEEQTFESIPEAFWWAIITMCTVGYGDKVPETFSGKVIGSLCAVSGVLTIALPVPVIVSNFDYFYQRERARDFHHSLTEKENSSNTIDPAGNSHTVMNGGSKMRREESIQRQKDIKKLENNRSIVGQKIQSFLRSKNNNQNENGNANYAIVERESVV